jgi:hypothetical protein
VHFCGPTPTDAGLGPLSCRKKGTSGAPCGSDGECVYGLGCVGGACGPLAEVKCGAPCAVGGPPCEADCYCAPDGTCRKLRDLGATCDAPNACKRGGACQGGSCGAWPDRGGRCVDDHGCPATLACQNGVCQATGALPPGTHQPCKDGGCAPGLYCASRGTCEWTILREGRCDALAAPSGCTPGLACDASSSRCRAPALTCP